MMSRIIYGTLSALGLTALILYGLYHWDINSEIGLGFHAYIALGLGIFFTVVLCVALAFLAFASARHNIDDNAHDLRDSGDGNKE